MRWRATTARWRAVGGALAVVVVSSGCGLRPVPVAEHEPLPGTTAVCADLLEDLPDVLADAVRRQVQPPSPGVAAWGRPPIILRCGVPDPTVDPTLAVLDVDGVGWYGLPGEGGTFFVTADRVATVEVAVPADYAPEAEVLVDLADAVRGIPEQPR